MPHISRLLVPIQVCYLIVPTSALQTTAARCHPKESPAYRVTLREATPTAILTMLWHWPGVRDSSSSNHTDQTWTYQGDIPHGQEEMAWLLGFTSVTNSSRDTKLRITATFVNTLGEATQTVEFDIGKNVKCSFTKQFVTLNAVQLVLQL